MNGIAQTRLERSQLLRQYQQTRASSEAICAPLSPEDHVVQTMPDVSPPKWHLAHTSWFYETFLLIPQLPGYRVHHPAYDHLFNSYYLTHGQPYPRPRRGLLSRPSVSEILDYRHAIDQAMGELIDNANEPQWEQIAPLIELGNQHEQQHQELLLTDILHILAQNPLKPVYQTAAPIAPQDNPPLHWHHHCGGLIQIGQDPAPQHRFQFDNEGPKHRVWLNDFQLANRPVSCGDYLAFIEDNGYQRPELWLSEGWAKCQTEQWQHPLYWEQDGPNWSQFTLHGQQQLNPAAPVMHLSQYEAEAYARWADKRLPSEAELEHILSQQAIQGHLRADAFDAQTAQLHSRSSTASDSAQQLYGDVWEWTASAYSAYPGYRASKDTIGEYNGKFMSQQQILRGGSYATPASHIRASYRNFFPPKDRWQITGLRLADDS